MKWITSDRSLVITDSHAIDGWEGSSRAEGGVGEEKCEMADFTFNRCVLDFFHERFLARHDGTHFYSQLWGGRGKLISCETRLASSTYRVSGSQDCTQWVLVLKNKDLKMRLWSWFNVLNKKHLPLMWGRVLTSQNPHLKVRCLTPASMILMFPQGDGGDGNSWKLKGSLCWHPVEKQQIPGLKQRRRMRTVPRHCHASCGTRVWPQSPLKVTRTKFVYVSYYWIENWNNSVWHMWIPRKGHSYASA